MKEIPGALQYSIFIKGKVLRNVVAGYKDYYSTTGFTLYVTVVATETVTNKATFTATIVATETVTTVVPLTVTIVAAETLTTVVTLNVTIVAAETVTSVWWLLRLYSVQCTTVTTVVTLTVL